MSKFEEILSLNVNDNVEEKDGKKYLSWADAWAYFVKEYPDATYEIVKFDGKPYYSDDSGAMVYTKVTAAGLTHEMWLPVMDGKNKAMKDKPYEYATKYGNKQVEPFTMFDINKTLMRCLTKNLAMFGLGLYIYRKEDFPDFVASSDDVVDIIQQIKELIKETNTKEAELLKFFNVSNIGTMSYEVQLKCKNMLEEKKAKGKTNE